jgi:hypothetical protein
MQPRFPASSGNSESVSGPPTDAALITTMWVLALGGVLVACSHHVTVAVVMDVGSMGCVISLMASGNRTNRINAILKVLLEVAVVGIYASVNLVYHQQQREHWRDGILGLLEPNGNNLPQTFLVGMGNGIRATDLAAPPTLFRADVGKHSLTAPYRRFFAALRGVRAFGCRNRLSALALGRASSSTGRIPAHVCLRRFGVRRDGRR